MPPPPPPTWPVLVFQSIAILLCPPAVSTGLWHSMTMHHLCIFCAVCNLQALLLLRFRNTSVGVTPQGILDVYNRNLSASRLDYMAAASEEISRAAAHVTFFETY